MSTSLSLHQLYAFHSIDREIFARLVITFMRDPAESLLVMSLWLWLEHMGFPSMIVQLINLPDSFVDVLADEAVSCIKCLESTNPIQPAQLPFTSRVMNREMNLQTFNEMKYSTISGMKNILNTTCARAFTDVLEYVLGWDPQFPRNIPGFPHPVFGNINVMTTAISTIHLPWKWGLIRDGTINDRTMFLTFSRGFPVTQDEVRELFTHMLGENCIEGVLMQEANTGAMGQPLFARLILNSVATVDRILRGRHIAKFKVNGKHIWARKYECRDQA